MRRILNIAVVLMAVVSTAACAPKHGKKTSSITYVDYSSEYMAEGETIDVPFSSQGGVKYVAIVQHDIGTGLSIFKVLETVSLILADRIPLVDLLCNTNVNSVNELTGYIEPSLFDCKLYINHPYF